jgi:predicted GNAT superfamily acetyltransferase
MFWSRLYARTRPKTDRGVRSDAAVLVYGDDFAMERTAQQIAAVLNSVDGAARGETRISDCSERAGAVQNLMRKPALNFRSLLSPTLESAVFAEISEKAVKRLSSQL